MADIELVIKIDEDVYNFLKKQVADGITNPFKILIANGTPQPKTGVLDKIRAEIDAHREKLKIMTDDDWYAGKIRGYDCAIEIIDKYKAENEGQ